MSVQVDKLRDKIMRKVKTKDRSTTQLVRRRFMRKVRQNWDVVRPPNLKRPVTPVHSKDRMRSRRL